MFARAIFISAVGFLLSPQWSSAKEPAVVHCDAPLGYIAVVELDAYALDILWRYRLRSPGPLLRMVIQQSGCFTVVERGVGVEAVLQERQLRREVNYVAAQRWAKGSWWLRTISSRRL